MKMRGWAVRNDTFTRCPACDRIAIKGVCCEKLERMNTLKKMAVDLYGEIEPVTRGSCTNGFNEVNGMLLYWFNDKAGSTHIVKDVIGS